MRMAEILTVRFILASSVVGEEAGLLTSALRSCRMVMILDGMGEIMDRSWCVMAVISMGGLSQVITVILEGLIGRMCAGLLVEMVGECVRSSVMTGM